MDVPIAVVAIFSAINAVIGICGNALLVAATVKSRHLHTICHVVIAVIAVVDLLHLFTPIVFVSTFFLNSPFPQSTCVYLLFIPIGASAATAPLCLLLGLDRLKAVVFPQFYKKMWKHKWLVYGGYVLVSGSYSLWIVSLTISQISDENTVSLCIYQVAFGDYMKNFAFLTLVMNLALTFVYIFTFLVLKKKDIGKSLQSVFRSISITVFLLLGGWVFGVAIGYLDNFYDNDRRLFTKIGGLFIEIACSSNVFVYYSRNGIYKNAIRSVLWRREEDSPNVSVSHVLSTRK